MYLAQKIRELVRVQATGFDVGTLVSFQDHLELERPLSNRRVFLQNKIKERNVS